MGGRAAVIYLTTPPPPQRRAVYRQLGIGVIVTPRMWNKVRPEWPCWAADNGCFAETPAAPFDADGWIAWLALQPREACLFATAPDVLGDARATWERSTPWLGVVRDLGFPPALVAQNGFDSDRVDWAAFDVLFIGGDDEFKLGRGFDLVREAAARSKRTHVGRINSERRWRAFDAVGADSADGTFLAFGPDNGIRRLRSWFSQPTLDLHL